MPRHAEEWEKEKKKRKDALQQACDAVIKVTRRFSDAHHALFRVFGGEVDGNQVWLPRKVHSAFHSYVSAALKAAGQPAPNAGHNVWFAKLNGQDSEAARAAVMTVLREAADVVDSKCKGKVNRPGGRRAFSFGGVSPRR